MFVAETMLFCCQENMANDPNVHTFSSSTVMSYSNGPDGNPQVYRATKSTRTGPGGVSND